MVAIILVVQGQLAARSGCVMRVWGLQQVCLGGGLLGLHPPSSLNQTPSPQVKILLSQNPKPTSLKP